MTTDYKLIRKTRMLSLQTQGYDYHVPLKSVNYANSHAVHFKKSISMST